MKINRELPTAFDLGRWALNAGIDAEVNGTRWWSQKTCDAMNKTDPRVHEDDHCCRWVSPYGFVPEAGCPLHD